MMRLTVEVRLKNQDCIPDDVIDDLYNAAMDQALEMTNQGYVEGELYLSINDIDYKAYFTAERSYH